MTNVVLASIHRNNSVVKFYDNVKVETIECETTFSGRRSISLPMQCFFPFEVRLGRSSELHSGWNDDNIFFHRYISNPSILPSSSICLRVEKGMRWVIFLVILILLFAWWKNYKLGTIFSTFLLIEYYDSNAKKNTKIWIFQDDGFSLAGGGGCMELGNGFWSVL